MFLPSFQSTPSCPSPPPWCHRKGLGPCTSAAINSILSYSWWSPSSSIIHHHHQFIINDGYHSSPKPCFPRLPGSHPQSSISGSPTARRCWPKAWMLQLQRCAPMTTDLFRNVPYTFGRGHRVLICRKQLPRRVMNQLKLD